MNAAADAADRLAGVPGFVVPSWSALARAVRPPPRGPEDFEPGAQRSGWQHEASSRMEQDFRVTQHFPLLLDSELALMRSQSGPGAGVALHTTPCNMQTRIEPQLFRVLLLRRLRVPLPFSRRNCRCGSPLDAPCSLFQSRNLGKARVCSGECSRTDMSRSGRSGDNERLRPSPRHGSSQSLHGRRLEVVADGLPLHGGAQLAIDTTMVSPLQQTALLTGWRCGLR